MSATPLTHRALQVLLACTLLLVCGAQPGLVRAAAPRVSPERYFPATGFSVTNDAFWEYFQRRGGTRIFGYPVSREFLFLGTRVQFFQRLVMQQQADGSVTTLNLLDQGLMPYNRINGSIFPEVDPGLKAETPSLDDPGYADRMVDFVHQVAPEEWNGLPVRFGSTFFNTVSYEEAFPYQDGDPNLMPLIDLEVWGAPTSWPSYDPSNRGFVYQRFQRGIMHYDDSCACTQGLLLADYFKAILTGQNLPPDLAEQAQGSRFYRQYDNSQPNGLRRPDLLPATNLRDAFEPDYGAAQPPEPSPMPAYAVAWDNQDVPEQVVAGQTFQAHVVVRNLGSSTWPNGGDHPVRLSYHWLRPDGAVVVWDGRRTGLPDEISPGGYLDVVMAIDAPDQPGGYVLVLDLVQEGVTWFSRAGAEVPRLPRQVTAPAPPASGEVNLALRRPAKASSAESSALGPARAVDGNPETRWASKASDPQWLQVDLGKVLPLHRVVLRWERAFGRTYEIQVSNDGEHWKTVARRERWLGKTDDEMTLAPGSRGRFVRVFGIERGTQWGYSLWEFEVY